MDEQDFRSLQEAYLGVYIQEEVDLWVSELVEEGYDIDEYTDEELLEAFLDERKNEDPKGIAYKAGINKPDAWGAPTKFGQEATRNSLAAGIKGVRKLQRAGVRINRHHRNKYLAYQVHKGWSKAAENSPHQNPEQKTRRSKLIQKTLGLFRKNLSKKERDKDVPFVKKAERAVNKKGEFSRDSAPEQTPRQKRLAQLQASQRERNAAKGVSESYDLYDIILSHLLDEGYAETEEAAEVIMVNMSEDWRESIVDEILDEANRGDQYATRGMSSGDAIAHKISRRNARSGYNPDERGGSRQPTTGPSMDSPSGPIAGGTRSRRDLTARNRGKRNRMAPDPQSTTGRIQHTSGGPKGGTKDPEVVGTNKYLRLQNFKRNPPKRTTSYYGN